MAALCRAAHGVTSTAITALCHQAVLAAPSSSGSVPARRSEGGAGASGGEHRPNVKAPGLRGRSHVLPVPQAVKERRPLPGGQCIGHGRRLRAPPPVHPATG